MFAVNIFYISIFIITTSVRYYVPFEFGLGSLKFSCIVVWNSPCMSSLLQVMLTLAVVIGERVISDNSSSQLKTDVVTMVTKQTLILIDVGKSQNIKHFLCDNDINEASDVSLCWIETLLSGLNGGVNQYLYYTGVSKPLIKNVNVVYCLMGNDHCQI